MASKVPESASSTQKDKSGTDQGEPLAPPWFENKPNVLFTSGDLSIWVKYAQFAAKEDR